MAYIYVFTHVLCGADYCEMPFMNRWVLIDMDCIQFNDPRGLSRVRFYVIAVICWQQALVRIHSLTTMDCLSFTANINPFREERRRLWGLYNDVVCLSRFRHQTSFSVRQNRITVLQKSAELKQYPKNTIQCLIYQHKETCFTKKLGFLRVQSWSYWMDMDVCYMYIRISKNTPYT
jgi:hypothetical protein